MDTARDHPQSHHASLAQVTGLHPLMAPHRVAGITGKRPRMVRVLADRGLRRLAAELTAAAGLVC